MSSDIDVFSNTGLQAHLILHGREDDDREGRRILYCIEDLSSTAIGDEDALLPQKKSGSSTSKSILQQAISIGIVVSEANFNRLHNQEKHALMQPAGKHHP